MANDLTVNGTSLRTFGKIANFDGVFAVGPLRGGNLLIPNVDGEDFQPKKRAAYVFTVPLIMQAVSEAAMSTLLTDLETLLNSSATSLTLVRSGLRAGTCQADFPSGLQPSLANAFFGRLALSFVNLSGKWT